MMGARDGDTHVNPVDKSGFHVDNPAFLWTTSRKSGCFMNSHSPSFHKAGDPSRKKSKFQRLFSRPIHRGKGKVKSRSCDSPPAKHKE